MTCETSGNGAVRRNCSSSINIERDSLVVAGYSFGEGVEGPSRNSKRRPQSTGLVMQQHTKATGMRG